MRIEKHIMLLNPFLIFMNLIQGQIIPTKNNSIDVDPFEESVVSAMLKIVDEKFDSLSSRMTSTERALTNLQYYNLRQFRIVNTHLHALDTLLQAIHGRIGQQDVNYKEVTTSVNLLKREVKNMELLNKRSFTDLDSSMAYLNKDMTQKFDIMQEAIIVSINTTGSGSKSNDFVSDAQQLSAADNSSVLCLDAVSRVERKIESLTNITTSTFDNLTMELTKETDNETETQLLMKSLIEVNDKVQQSINFYRHTGDLVERIVGATETVSDDQTRIRDDIRHFLEVQTNNSAKCHVTRRGRGRDFDGNDISNEINPVVDDLGEITSKKSQRCELSLRLLDELTQLSTNATKVMEAMHDLAQVGQASVKSGLWELENEVTKLKEVRERMDNGSYAVSSVGLLSGLMEYNVEELSNNTKAIYKMVEAIASNTGWIPYIYHNLKFVEGKVNQTLMTSQRALKHAISRDTIQAKVSVQYKPQSTEAGGGDVGDKMDGGTEDRLVMLVNETYEMIEQMNFVHRTNKKLYRLIPALTKLLAEPEPFFTLVDGDTDNEGRIEVYKQGHWGTICDPMSHIQASYICRHLGYLGGVATEPGYFGTGSGEFWRVNYTCLFTKQCQIAELMIESSHCDHGNDMGLICDHMVRLRYETINDDTIRRNSGFAEIYHAGSWTPVCADGWSADNTRVVCRQLGYGSGTNRNLTSDDGIEEYPITSQVAFLNATCTGSESHLDACNGGYWSKYSCVSKTPIFLICST